VRRAKAGELTRADQNQADGAVAAAEATLAQTEAAATAALQQLKAVGTTILIAAHRPSIVSQADKIMIVREGRLVQFGPAAEILPTISSNNLRRVGV
jgi:ABC-type protease/lipase transport system fused ATPase/permease subunit